MEATRIKKNIWKGNDGKTYRADMMTDEQRKAVGIPARKARKPRPAPRKEELVFDGEKHNLWTPRAGYGRIYFADKSYITLQITSKNSFSSTATGAKAAEMLERYPRDVNQLTLSI